MFCVTLSGKERYCSVLNNLRHANYRPSHSTKHCGYMHERPNLGGAFKVLYGSGAALCMFGEHAGKIQPKTLQFYSQSCFLMNCCLCQSWGRMKERRHRESLVLLFLCKKDKNEPIMSSKCLLWKPQGGRLFTK